MKKLFEYTKYFFYLGINWNFRLAWFILRKEIAGETKYQLQTTGVDDLTNSVAAHHRVHASIYQPVNFYTAEQLFAWIDETDLPGTFLDIGCGKGRVLALAAAYGFRNIIGVDFSAQLCHDAIQLSDQVEERYPGTIITIECEDVRNYHIPSSVSVLFLFNPFDDLVMKDFLYQVKRSLRKKPRKLKVLYANPQCKNQWLEAGFEEIHGFRKMKYLEGSVLVNSPTKT